jgi:hypothetical protein
LYHINQMITISVITLSCLALFNKQIFVLLWNPLNGITIGPRKPKDNYEQLPTDK